MHFFHKSAFYTTYRCSYTWFPIKYSYRKSFGYHLILKKCHLLNDLCQGFASFASFYLYDPTSPSQAAAQTAEITGN